MRIIIAKCEIDYEGRAASSLSIGERVIIIKNDNTVLIHTENKLKPINYMTNSKSIEFHPNIVDFDTIVAKREKPFEEIINIYITELIQDIKLELTDENSFSLSGSEKDIQEYLVENPDVIEKGFKIIGIEYPTTAGKIDIFGHDKNGVNTIVEIKRVKGSQAAVGQLRRYYESLEPQFSDGLRAILISDGISAPALETLKGYGFQFLDLSHKDLFPSND